MKYIKQFFIICLFSFFGELCHFLIPLSIPPSIYGMALLFAALALKRVPLEQVQETGQFLTFLLPLLFIVPAAGLMEDGNLLLQNGWAAACILALSLVASFAAAGWVTQVMIRIRRKKQDEGNAV